jgi:hypothetical protein
MPVPVPVKVIFMLKYCFDRLSNSLHGRRLRLMFLVHFIRSRRL